MHNCARLIATSFEYRNNLEKFVYKNENKHKNQTNRIGNVHFDITLWPEILEINNQTPKSKILITPVKSYSQVQTTSSSLRTVVSDYSTGLTQQISELKTNDNISRFLISVGTPFISRQKRQPILNLHLGARLCQIQGEVLSKVRYE